MKNKLTLLFLVQTDFNNNGKENDTDMWKTLLFAILGSSAQYASQAISNAITATGKIDWAHVGTAAIVGAVTTAGALHVTPPAKQQ